MKWFCATNTWREIYNLSSTFCRSVWTFVVTLRYVTSWQKLTTYVITCEVTVVRWKRGIRMECAKTYQRHPLDCIQRREDERPLSDLLPAALTNDICIIVFLERRRYLLSRSSCQNTASLFSDPMGFTRVFSGSSQSNSTCILILTYCLNENVFWTKNTVRYAH